VNEFKPKTPEEERIRGGEAARLLDSPLFKECCAHIEETMAEQRRAVPLRETEMHTRLIMMEQLYGNFLDFFQQIAQTGRIADLQIQQKRSLAQQIFRR